MNKCTAYLLLGSNMGNRTHWLSQGFNYLIKQVGTIVALSPIYETAAWGKTTQAPFLNQALSLSTTLNAQDLLQHIQAIETKLGRTRHERWESRIIDIDILGYGDHVVESANLQIPHPLLPMRRFALLPLCHIAPTWQHPILQKTSLELLHLCPDTLPCYVYMPPKS